MANDDAVRALEGLLDDYASAIREQCTDDNWLRAHGRKDAAEYRAKILALATAPAAPPAEQLDEVRRKVIEECARVCDAQCDEIDNTEGDWPGAPDVALNCAAAIRALASKGEENLPTEGKGE